MSRAGTYASLMEPVARILLGEPNARLSRGRELRFRTRGSLCVDRHRGVYHDHEANTGGGVLDLIKAVKGLAGGDAIAWLREQGFDLAEVGNDRVKPHHDGRPRIVATYNYNDAAGQVSFQVVRYDPKDFRQRRPDPASQDGWIWGLRDAERLVYRLAEVIDAVAKDRVVYIAEGEKAVDALAGIGVTATCSPMGAGKWLPEYSQTFCGAHVVILPDNDEAGGMHKDQVVATLTGLAASVRVLELPHLPYKGDAYDWIEAGGTADQLAELSEAAPPLNYAVLSDASVTSAQTHQVERLPLFPPLPAAEPYPVHALGPILGEAASAIARKVQAPVALAAQSVLATAALAAQAYADVLMPYGQSRPLSLYLLSIASSGDRKSTTDNEALWPIARREESLQEQHGRDHQDWLVAHAAWSAEKKKIEGERNLRFEDRKARLAALGPEPQPPIRPVLISAEPTLEGLVKSWSSLPPAQGVFSAEGGQFIGGHSMAQENRLRTGAGFSALWDAKPLARIRALDGVSSLRGRRLTMNLMVQPRAAAAFLSDPVLRDQGLLGRVLVAAPDSIAGTRRYRSPSEADAEQIGCYRARILDLLEGWPIVVNRTQGLQPRELVMGPEAEASWRQFHDRVEERCGQQGDLRPVCDFATKAAEHAARIAGVLTIVDDERAVEIPSGAMDAAVHLATWYLGEVLRLLGANRTDPKLLQAQALLSWMQDQPSGTCLLRDILRLGPSATRTKKEAEAALAILQQHGRVEEVSRRPCTFRAHLENEADSP
ncbi:DUF3987 domain-containing protein [Methylobacterium mesophilicum SR1.6/6]|uniref:DUF3987 domain-containing protein n=1 Tax=Methylobacterium mesophilicum SR1.6/6 TaxID=908290 RepID=A0A6B9FIE7_9HYPH|nr:DUF3987 domain-containing protein [Methylobacterium mesophilicum]QGY01546.1 DUF3987 domain-containing protein [Methylobacterium mesophilicum SR1.6/6]